MTGKKVDEMFVVCSNLKRRLENILCLTSVKIYDEDFKSQILKPGILFFEVVCC